VSSVSQNLGHSALLQVQGLTQAAHIGSDCAAATNQHDSTQINGGNGCLQYLLNYAPFCWLHKAQQRVDRVYRSTCPRHDWCVPQGPTTLICSEHTRQAMSCLLVGAGAAGHCGPEQNVWGARPAGGGGAAAPHSAPAPQFGALSFKN
jgi:hypothetical protein